MSTIDPSTILTTQPPATAPTTSGVRGVFGAVKAQITAAKADIEAIETDVTTAQGDIVDLQGDIVDLQGDVSDLDTALATHASRHLPSGADPLTSAAPETVSTITGANAEGSAESYARSDHAHRAYVANLTTAALPAPNPGQGGRLAYVTDAEGGQLQTSGGVVWSAVAPGVDHSHDGVGSVAVDHTDLGAVGADDHHTEDHAARHAPGGADALSTVGFEVGDIIETRLGLAGYKATVEAAADVAGGAYVDPSTSSVAGLARTVTFRALLSTTDAGHAAHVQLYDLTAAVEICDLSTTSLSPVMLSQALTVGTSGANEISSSAHLYEIRVWVATGAGTEMAILHSAALCILHEAEA